MSTILLISPRFFGYEQDIVDALRADHHEVDFVDERPSNNSVWKVLLRLAPVLTGWRVRRYFRGVAADLRDDGYDILLVIKGEVVPRWFLKEVQRRGTQTESVFYTYDSLLNSHQCLRILDLFERRYSFDRLDAGRADFRYLPLFFAPAFVPPAGGVSRDLDVSFVGTAHSDRFQLVASMTHNVDAKLLFFYVPARWYFVVRKLFFKGFSGMRCSDVSFETLTRIEVAAVFHRSRAVIDIQRTRQTGLTMRTFEVLASGAVLATTNSSIVHEDIFDPDWVIVIPKAQEATEAFDLMHEIELREARAPLRNLSAYSLKSWVDEIILNGKELTLASEEPNHG